MQKWTTTDYLLGEDFEDDGSGRCKPVVKDSIECAKFMALIFYPSIDYRHIAKQAETENELVIYTKSVYKLQQAVRTAGLTYEEISDFELATTSEDLVSFEDARTHYGLLDVFDDIEEGEES